MSKSKGNKYLALSGAVLKNKTIGTTLGGYVHIS